jgi:hypothetical protein
MFTNASRGVGDHDDLADLAKLGVLWLIAG